MRIAQFNIIGALIFLMCPGRGLSQSAVAVADTLGYEYPVCKLPVPVLVYISERMPRDLTLTKMPLNKKSLFAISGEASYQRFIRNASSDNLLFINSSSDIAVLQLNLLYKESYPYIARVGYNSSRPFQLDDPYEVDIRFDNRSFRQLVEQKANSLLKEKYFKKQQGLLSEYTAVFQRYQQQKSQLQSPSYLQKAVEGRLQNPLAAATGSPNLRGLPTLPTLSNGLQVPSINRLKDEVAIQSFLSQMPQAKQLEQRARDSANAVLENQKNKLYGKIKNEKDSLESVLKKLEDSLAVAKNQFNKALDSANKQMSSLQTSTQLKKYADDNGLRDSLAKDKWAYALMRTDVRFGKFILNQSELTVNNIFLHGVSIKYGDERFVMVSVGVYDFAFRELFNLRRDSSRYAKPGVLGIKLGKTDGRNLQAFNFYLGRKSKDASLTNELRTVAGVGFERKIFFNRDVSFEFEVAKSTTRTDNGLKDHGTLQDLFTTISTKTIGAYSAFKAYLPKTQTDAEINYKYWGQQFESFSASQYFNPQNNFSAKLGQPFFNRKLYLSSGLKYTDFSSPGISNNIKSKTFFASANATLRLKKLPIISLGYYPGSQLYWVDRSKLYEYFYYILNGTVSHSFRAAGLPMQAVFAYNKFFNRYTDSLVSGSQSYYSLFWTAWKNSFSYTMNFSRQQVENNLLSTVETGVAYSKAKLRAGGSMKWNFSDGKTKPGYSLNIGVAAGKIGTVNLMYDKSFLPERTGLFLPVETAQVQIIKPLNFKIWQ